MDWRAVALGEEEFDDGEYDNDDDDAPEDGSAKPGGVALGGLHNDKSICCVMSRGCIRAQPWHTAQESYSHQRSNALAIGNLATGSVVLFATAAPRQRRRLGRLKAFLARRWSFSKWALYAAWSASA